LSSGGSTSLAATTARYLPFTFDHSGSVIGATSINPESSAAMPSPNPPVFTSSTSSGFNPADCTSMLASAWLVERGLVYPIFRPFKSLSVLIGESGFTAQTNSATVSTLSLTILRSAPASTAETTTPGFTSPYGTPPPASMLRKVVPPPADEMRPVMLSPSSLK
jgi:hypothetical protein